MAGKDVVGAGIGIEARQVTVGTGHVPGGSLLHIDDEAGPRAPGLGGGAAQAVVGALGGGKEAVGTLAAAPQPAVEAHPLGAAQGRLLHVVGALDERYARGGEGAVARMLHRRHRDGVGREGYEALHVGGEGGAEGGGAPATQVGAQQGVHNVGGIAEAGHEVAAAQVGGQRGMDGRGGDHAAQGSAHQCAFGQTRGHAVGTGHEEVAVHHAPFVPRVHHLGHRGRAFLAHTQQAGMAQALGRAGAFGGAGGAEQDRQDGEQEGAQQVEHEREGEARGGEGDEGKKRGSAPRRPSDGDFARQTAAHAALHFVGRQAVPEEEHQFGHRAFKGAVVAIDDAGLKEL